MKTKEEIEILRADALAGDSRAQNDLGCAYSSGDGVTKNLKEAFRWFELSAKQGNEFGQYNLGRYYQTGSGVRKNLKLAIEWLRKSAEQGFDKAAYLLGTIYENGYQPKGLETMYSHELSISADPEEAFYWYYQSQYD